MILKDILPAEPLKEYIRHYRLRHFIFPDGMIPRVKPFPPRPEQCLSFYVRGFETVNYLNGGLEFKKPRSVLSGQFTCRTDRYVSAPEILMIIVDFIPGALHRLLHIPFSEFINKDIDAETVFSSELKRVNERLNSTDSYQEMTDILDRFFLQLVQQSKKEKSAIDKLLFLISGDPDHSIDWMAQNAYLSIRQLERKFHETIGISPKAFLRIARFNQSYWMHLKNRNLSWFKIAMYCGYTDYQHLAKEYRQFTNTTPHQFFIEENHAPGRVLGLNKL